MIVITFGLNGFSQIRFNKPATLVQELHSSGHQNYLVLNPHAQTISFSEKMEGILEKKISKRTSQIAGSEWMIYSLSIPVQENGIISPIGFDKENGLYFNEVKKQYNQYSGKINYYAPNGHIVETQIPYFTNRSPTQSGVLSKDGNYMIISMEGSYTYGVDDLYVIKRKPDGTWAKPINLGANINSNFQEVTPFLAPDNKILFFASNKPGGYGSYDIYQAERLGSWREWSELINLGAFLNTKGSETSFSFIEGSDTAYFIRSKNSESYGDVMKIFIYESILLDSNQTTPEPIVKTDKKMVDIKVIDIKTKQLLSAEIISKEQNTIEIKANGYFSKMVLLDQITSDNNIIALEPIEVGNNIVLNNVLFHRGTSNMVEDAYSEINLLVEMMKENPNIKILLKGHTDNTGNPVKNKKLSEDRAEVIKKYLIDSGINLGRVTGKGFGGKQPIASNKTEATRKLNRRVEFEILKN